MRVPARAQISSRWYQSRQERARRETSKPSTSSPLAPVAAPAPWRLTIHRASARRASTPTRGDASNRRSFAAVPWRGDDPVRQEARGRAVLLALAGRRRGPPERRPARDAVGGLAVAPVAAPRDPSPEHGLVNRGAGLLVRHAVEQQHVAGAG